eukprot:TRINITY_DN15317_c0_g5_i1.p1 TRINITY_DN15317_c0_g5~~TRINITY_DN15317_c0_g5_i1.p1  ORF type:complete len:349 (+),score=63.83 TRINITY_DN15317_c0_g5_i1:121-1167(+)
MKITTESREPSLLSPLLSPLSSLLSLSSLQPPSFLACCVQQLVLAIIHYSEMHSIATLLLSAFLAFFLLHTSSGVRHNFAAEAGRGSDAAILRAPERTEEASPRHVLPVVASSLEGNEAAKPRDQTQSSLTEASSFNVSRGRPGDYDFMYFVLQWPGTCAGISGGCCGNTGYRKWTIHGLWPNYKGGRYPDTCDFTPYNKNLMSDLRTMLVSVWPTFSCGATSGDYFWGHEWAKHGTCTEGEIPNDGSGSTEHSYFSAALALYKKVNVIDALGRRGIRPSAVRSYSFTDVKSALTSAFGATSIYLQCAKGQIWQVYVCVDVHGRSIISCELPSSARGSCPTRVTYPPS